MQKHFIDISDFSAKEIEEILNLGADAKKNPHLFYDSLKHKKLILLLEKNSTRTRVSFEFAIKELGGHCCVLNSNDSQISRGEPLSDTAKVLDRYADFIVFRTFAHSRLLQMQDNCKRACVVNALTDDSHPCQIMADIMTILEQKNISVGELKDLKIAWIGDINNMLFSWVHAAEKLNFHINIFCPEVYKNKLNEGKNALNFTFFSDKTRCVENCDVVTTDTFVSMGESKEKLSLFEGFIVDANLMKNANENAIFLHCLPAYRGFEVAEDVIDNDKYSSIIFDEAENRLHIQKAILLWLGR
jgi:ornithine carbamoyltransferase